PLRGLLASDDHFLQRLRHTRSPLFPSTTLFRSGRRGELPPLTHPLKTAHKSLPGRALAVGDRGENLGDGPTVNVRHRRERRPDLDRKSTRLNSSHVKISYAVFCLKRKKNDHRRH